MGTIDKEGKMHILPDMQYRSIYDFVDGIAIAFQNEKWGLIDTEGNHISEFKYNFVEPAPVKVITKPKLVLRRICSE